LNARFKPDRQMQFRMGINLGDVIYDDVRIYGDGINIAARLESIAEPGGICVSEKVFEEIRDKIQDPFVDLGTKQLKNIARPVRVYASKPAANTEPQVTSRRAGLLRLPDKPSIAILPFANMSGDKEQEYVADGIVEDVITALSQVSSLFVVARHSSFTFKDKSVDIRDIGRQLGVRFVLEGSVRRSGDRLRVSAQLVDATTGVHVWAERYDRRVEDVFDIQDELTREIVTALRIHLTDGEQASIWLRSTRNFEAWGYATQGADAIWRGTANDMQKARELLERAVACDPGYGKAIALISTTHYFDIRFNYSKSRPESMRLLSETARRSIELNPDEPYAVLAIANEKSLHGEFEEAVAIMQVAVDKCPSDALCWLGHARLLIGAEKVKEAEVAIRHAMRLNPIYPINYLAVLGDALVHQARHHEALEVFQEIVGRQPNYISAHLHLASLHMKLGQTDAAQMEIGEVLRINPQYRVGAAATFYLTADTARKEAFLESLRSAGLPE